MKPTSKPVAPLSKSALAIQTNKKNVLGHRAFLLFLMRWMHWVLLFFAFAFAAWYGERWIPAAASYEIVFWYGYAVKMLFLLSAAFFVLVFVRTYLEYRYYTYMFTTEAFIVTQGYIVRNEVATVYHQIQNVNIKRTPLDRLIGVSQLVIFMTGADRSDPRDLIILPGVGNKKARLVQQELLVRARRHAVAAQAMES